MSQFPEAVFRYRSMPSVASNVPVTMSESRSLITYARATDAQRWEIEVEGFVLPKNRKAFQAWLMALNGRLTVFTYSLPTYGKSAAANKLTTTAVASGISTIPVNSITNIEAGDFLKFGGHSKMYQVTSVGTTSIEVFPSLRDGVASGETVNFQTPTFSMRLRDDVQRFTASSHKHPDEYSISMIEVL